MSEANRREHDWDVLRALLMLLGIPYHASMAYNTNVIWDIHSPDESGFLTFLSGFLVTFRMPAFFIAAGYFSVMMLSRKPAGSWLKGRYIRLGVPFLSCLVLIVPLQLAMIPLSEALRSDTTIIDAWHRAEIAILHPGVEWIMHLWFLPALLAYCTLLAVGWLLSSRPISEHCLTRFTHWLGRRQNILFVPLLALFMVWELTLRAVFIELENLHTGLASLAARGLDPYLRYLPYFLLGALLRHTLAMRHIFRMPMGNTMPLATVLTASIAAFTRSTGMEILDLVNALATGAAAIMASRLLIGYAGTHWNRPSAHVDRIVDASFTIYLLHHPIIYVLATAFIPLHWPPVIEFLIIAFTAGVLSYAAHRLIRRNPTALFLMNGRQPGTFR